ncbi:hypothetical protein [Blastococcus sp. TF02A-26]|uniref:hypothetical protein n=1 Tax=Blastococcus sp. TF02A-26 TaxID=2250577 RepID=UPI000DEB8329|nr:hypothetical protein [Blastococcus sp. TF02A-26]RBY83118.1 hypothetical protein DQ240_17035 [Blastococcus sp. TF02A-26]
MLEVGKRGSAGVGKDVVPVLRDGVVVAQLRTSGWKESAAAVVGEREWVFAKQKRELTGRWALDPESSARLRARQVSMWKGTWEADLEGVPVSVAKLSVWKGTHRFTSGDRVLGESGSTGGWSPRPTVRLPDSMPLEHQVFLLWLMLVIGRRNDSAATGAIVAGGAAAAGS